MTSTLSADIHPVGSERWHQRLGAVIVVNKLWPVGLPGLYVSVRRKGDRVIFQVPEDSLTVKSEGDELVWR